MTTQVTRNTWEVSTKSIIVIMTRTFFQTTTKDIFPIVTTTTIVMKSRSKIFLISFDNYNQDNFLDKNDNE